MSMYGKLIRPALFKLPAETAHELGMAGLRLGMSLPGASSVTARLRRVPASLASERFGLAFRNPVGVAAGFDKNGKAVGALAALGFGCVEVGTVTLRPQSGNPRPRMFRLPGDGAIINRLGFNNEGAEAVARRLSGIRRDCIVGVNIGKNKDVPNEEALENYLATLELLHPVADYITVNVSSPNTPDLRKLQQGDLLENLLGGLLARNRALGAKPMLVKIAPDLSQSEVEEVADLCVGLGVSGIIATNTTMSRDGLSRDPGEAGGLSGRPLRGMSTAVVSTIFRRTRDRLPIIGVGGVFGPRDAFEKIRAGASLLQVYTGFVYEGPGIARKINLGLSELIQKEGFSSLSEAVGSGVDG
jgi:dihydroorotate dehydrogenase